MAIRKVFENDDHELEIYNNDKGRLFISIQQSSDSIVGGFITLDIDEARVLLKDLKKYISFMENHG